MDNWVTMLKPDMKMRDQGGVVVAAEPQAHQAQEKQGQPRQKRGHGGPALQAAGQGETPQKAPGCWRP